MQGRASNLGHTVHDLRPGCEAARTTTGTQVHRVARPWMILVPPFARVRSGETQMRAQSACIDFVVFSGEGIDGGCFSTWRPYSANCPHGSAGPWPKEDRLGVRRGHPGLVVEPAYAARSAGRPRRRQLRAAGCSQVRAGRSRPPAARTRAPVLGLVTQERSPASLSTPPRVVGLTFLRAEDLLPDGDHFPVGIPRPTGSSCVGHLGRSRGHKNAWQSIAKAGP